MLHRLEERPRQVSFVYTTLMLGGLIGVAYWFLVSPSGGVLRDREVRLAVIGGWWAMLGGVAISYKGIADHRTKAEWDEGWTLWYVMRPFASFVVGLVTFAILQVANTQAQPSVFALALAAFVFGTQERRFFSFLYEVARLVVSTPGGDGQGLQVTSINPDAGKPGSILMIGGQGFLKDAVVTVGGVDMTDAVPSPDGTSIAGTVPGGQGTVAVVVTNPDNAARRAPKRFTYSP